MEENLEQKLNEVETMISDESSSIEDTVNDIIEGVSILTEAVSEIPAIIDQKISEIKQVEAKDGKDGKDGVNGKDGENGKDGKNGKDGQDGIDGVDGSPDEPKDIKKKLESLKGDLRLDKKAIKGLDDVMDKSDLDRAISILDKRTQYLINKRSTSTSGGGAFSSITGTPTEVAYFDLAGNGTSDSLFTRNPNTKETFIGLTGTDLASNLHITPTGNTLTWDADTTDDISTSIIQSDNILNAGVKGTAILYADSVTEEKALILVGDGTSSGGEPFQISLRTDDGTGNVSTFVSIDNVNGISMGAEDLGVSFISSYIDFTLTGNTIQWDADTTDTISTKLEQSQNLFGLGFSGTGISWSDSNTGVTGILGTVDGTGVGTYAGSTTMGTINDPTGASAFAGSNYNTSTDQPEFFINTALGDFDSGLNSNDQYIQLLHRDVGVGEQSQIVVQSGNTYLSYKASTASNEYQAVLSDGTFSVTNRTAGSNIVYIDIANRQSIIGNVSSVGGIKMFIDDAVGINVQAPGGVVNIGGNTYGNNTNIQVDDINQIVTITNVPTYADDATAVTGGLTTGNLYKTTTGGSTFLKIVP